MHFAKLEHSDRLKRVLDILKENFGEPKTTRDIIKKAGVCAVNSAISELRANGIEIRCRCIKRGIFEYTLNRNDK